MLKTIREGGVVVGEVGGEAGGDFFGWGGGVVDWVVIHKLQLNLLKFFCRNFVKIIS